MDTSKFVTFTENLAEKSGELIRSYYANPDLEVISKQDDSPVTAADRKAEEIMREMIHKSFPEHGIIGEEFGEENPEAEFTWVLDPIDGTISFARGCPLFGTLICLLHKGKPVVGAIHQPVIGQLCLGTPEGTTLNGRPVRIRKPADLSECTLLTTDLKNIKKYQNVKNFEELIQKTKTFRTWGDCYGYLMLASGWADIMMDPVLKKWDLMALIPVIQGAGGKITTWQGNDAVTGDSCVAAHPDIHDKVIRILNQ